MKRALALAALALAACMSPDSGPSRPGPMGPDPVDPGPVDPGPVDPGVKPGEGGGSDTETLTGMVTQGDGRPAHGIAVKLLPSDYDPSRPDTAAIRRGWTDTAGRFRFEKVDTGRTWNVIAGDPAGKAWALARDLRPGPSETPLALSLGKVFLISLHSGTYGKSDSGIAYFPGTDILTRCNGFTESVVDSVPDGALRLVVESRAGWKHDTTLAAVGERTRIRAEPSRIWVLP